MIWLSYSTNWLVHFRAVSECLAKIGGRATCSMDTGALDVRARGRRVELFPQFGLFHPGGMGYSPKLTPSTVFFVGWRPYVNRFWPLSFDKRAFKAFCRGNGVQTPRQWTRPEEVETDVLIKRGVSSFSEGLKGPYTPAAVRRMGRTPGDGEFFEEFITGEILKVSYWNTTPVCLEVVRMPTVTGDGAHTFRQLINLAKFPYVPGLWEEWQDICDYQGLSFDSVVPKGRRVLIDFRYHSRLHPGSADYTNENVLASFTGTPLMDQLRRSGQVFWRGIPEAVRQQTLFTVDGILDRNGTAHFVEINSNPAMHPDCYSPMFEDLFAAGATGQVRRRTRPIPAAAATAAAAR